MTVNQLVWRCKRNGSWLKGTKTRSNNQLKLHVSLLNWTELPSPCNIKRLTYLKARTLLSLPSVLVSPLQLRRKFLLTLVKMLSQNLTRPVSMYWSWLEWHFPSQVSIIIWSFSCSINIKSCKESFTFNYVMSRSWENGSLNSTDNGACMTISAICIWSALSAPCFLPPSIFELINHVWLIFEMAALKNRDSVIEYCLSFQFFRKLGQYQEAMKV